MTLEELLAMDAAETRAHINDLLNFDDGARILRELGPNPTHGDVREYLLAQQAEIDAFAAEVAEKQQGQ